MRRSQSTLLITLAVVAGLLFMSQFPALSPVASNNPNEATGEAPPVTDSDGDLIPDVHENLFEDWVNRSTADGRMIVIPGLDRDDARDAKYDLDRDGLNATEEYCWPYPANCTQPGFPRGLTGLLDENGERSYLDPRVSDTDGDGLPDGFEAWMCLQTGGYNAVDMVFRCPRFDPLNASEGAEDPDEDGFDVDRNGIIDANEMYTSAEEYRHGMPPFHVDELDGLWCAASLPEGGPFDDWPYISTSANMTFANLLAACTTNSTSVFDDDLWLGTNPLNADSDHRSWNGVSLGRTFPSFGDGLPDGWEVHFGLDPLNRSNALLDVDQDGWDEDRDGFVTGDPVTTETGVSLGEALSSYEEYLVHDDMGNVVRSGLKHVAFGADDTWVEVPVRLASPSANVAILHHDVRDLHVNDQDVYILTRHGITHWAVDEDTSNDMWWPHAIRLTDMVPLNVDGALAGFAVTSTGGLQIIPLLEDGTLAPMETWSHMDAPALEQAVVLDLDGASIHILALGANGDGGVWTLGSDLQPNGDVMGALSPGLRAELATTNATVTSLAHAPGVDGVPTLFVGTDRGLVVFETASARDATLNGTWLFHFAFETTVVERNLDPLRPIGANVGDAPAEVRDLVVDGAGPDQLDTVWMAMPSGLHRLDLRTLTISHGGDLVHPGQDGRSIVGADDVHSVLVLDDALLVGSAWGLWVVDGGREATYGAREQALLPGELATLATVEVDGVLRVLAGAAPGRFANQALMSPVSNDSDFDGMTDGWELIHGLDPTDPWDAVLDPDGDGLDKDLDGFADDRLWSNLDEYRYIAITTDGYDSTDPSNPDTDMDGATDGAEVHAFHLSSTTLWCYYDFQMTYRCDSAVGAAANQTYMDNAPTDTATDPTNPDSDGDGMPDGWEIEHRRWVGTTFDGGNNWTLDPMRADDALWDADRDGLANICEYQWSVMRDLALNGDFVETHGESPSAAETWAETDPNNPDSDGDTMTDGWEAGGLCSYDPTRVGVNPLNGSDGLENPDGDGFDVNLDGVLEPGEAFVNWLEFHIKDLDVVEGAITFGVYTAPEGLELSLFEGMLLGDEPGHGFIDDADLATLSTAVPTAVGSTDPLDTDSDGDGMPDGWEIHFARWAVLDDRWTLNPIDRTDRFLDADDDGMTNWEEYNAIDPALNQIESIQSSPQFFVTTVGTAPTLQQWATVLVSESFGSFASEAVLNASGPTADPNNPDTDGDGIIDGMEVLFTAWNDSAQTWTLNPLVPGDGDFDADGDGLLDRQELALAFEQPDNGEVHPADAPLFHIDGDNQQPTEKSQRIFRILIDKDTRGKRYLGDFNSWQQGEVPSEFISFLMGLSDPTNSDTDDDGMHDGFEYWFTSWNLEENRWGMNPLIDSDVNLDSDGDSWDCNGDGIIDLNETFSNLREWESSTWGKYLARFTVPVEVGVVTFGEDAMSAYMSEAGLSAFFARAALYDDFIAKGPDSANRMLAINGLDPNNFNRTLLGVADPTHPDSDSDGLPDGWEYCYARYDMPDPSTALRWAANPLNPFDVDHDGDSDGWYDRTSFDTPAPLGSWNDRSFTASGGLIQQGVGDLPFTNWMEYENGTRPDLNDSDGDSVAYLTTVENGAVVAHERDYNLSDGREVFKYGTNPMDNDTDGDMIPDWYEHAKGWNETNDNYSSWLQIRVQWIDTTTGGGCTTDTNSCRPLSIDSGSLSRPNLAFTWFTMDPRDATDANEDHDQDGNWDCSGAGCVYTPYTAFQEFYAITDPLLSSPNAVRLAGLVHEGEGISEGWQLRAHLLGLGAWDENVRNYLKMDQLGSSDQRFVWILNDKDQDFLIIDETDDEVLAAGNRTDPWEIFYTGSPQTSPVRSVGEHELGWYMVDLDDDHVAEGTDPLNWDTDGDWVVDWFEVNDDERDGVRGDSSPLRYDSRLTS